MLFPLQYSNQNCKFTAFIAIFVPKSFVDGRKDVLPPFQKIKPTDQTIWFHAASLGNMSKAFGN
jgi:3-deoxy-D-manno-octulosonic-acid transferase